jgi:hypothetical protein
MNSDRIQSLKTVLPQASIGGYGSMLTDSNAAASAFLTQDQEIDRLACELSAAIARREVAWNKLNAKVGA